MKRYPNLLRVKVEVINNYAWPIGIHHDCSRLTRACGFLKETDFVVLLGGINMTINANSLAHCLAQGGYEKIL